MNFLKKKFARSVSTRFSGLIIVTLAGIINSILTARLLGPDGKGIYFLLYSTLTMIIAIGAIKLSFSQVYYRKRMPLSEMIGASLVLSLKMGLIAVIIGLIGVVVLRDVIFEEVPWDYVLVTVGLVPVLLLANNLSSLLDADYQIGRATIMSAVRPLIFMLMFSGLALAGWNTVGTAVASMVISITCMTIVGLIFVLRTTSISWSDINFHDNRMLSYAKRSHIGLLFRRMQDRFDIFIVAYFMTPADVGIYSVALVVSEIAGKFSQVVSSVLLGRLAVSKEEKNRIELTMRLNRIIFFITFCSVIFLALVASYLVDMAFGSDFSRATSAIIILLPGVLAVSVFRILNTNLVTSGRPGLFSKIASTGVFVMIAGDILLIPQYGIDGAALASTIAYIVTAVTMTVVVVRNNVYPLRDYFNVIPELNQLLALMKN